MRPFFRYTGLAALCAMLATLLSGCDFTRFPKDKSKTEIDSPDDFDTLGGVIIFDSDEEESK